MACGSTMKEPQLIEILKKYYKVSIDWEGKNYCGLIFDWYYDHGYVDVSMLGYIFKALEKFQHEVPKHPQHSSYWWNKPVYGSKIQYAKAPDISTCLNMKGQHLIQSIMGTFLYYARAIDGVALPALNDI
eukprot:12136755-Ditylum_brightwellii.AAC.1